MRLTTQQARERFSRARVARFATTDAGGQPHIVPVTFAMLGEPASTTGRADDTGDTVAIAIDQKPKRTTDLKRLRNIRANPRVSLLADRYEDDWTQLWWVRADGRARVTSDTSDRAERTRPLRELTAKYPQYRTEVPGGPLILVAVDLWTGWAYG